MLNHEIHTDIKSYYDQRAPLQLYPYAESWDNVIEKFANLLDRIIQKQLNRSSSKIKVYDCTCGIGTQALGLRAKGYEVAASDLSPEMVRFANQYAEERNLKGIEFFSQDLRSPLPDRWHQQFDVSMSINNSLVFLSNEEEGDSELVSAINNIHNSLKPDGVILLSLRPYDEYLKTRPSEPPRRNWQYRSFGNHEVRFSQKYDWLNNNKHYICHTKYERRWQDGSFDEINESVKVRAWREEEIIKVLTKNNFKNIESSIKQDQSGHYREIWFQARK